MEGDCGRDQVEARRRRDERNAGEKRGEFVALQVPAQVHPVVERLDGQVNIFRNFQFEYSEAAGGRDGQQIDDVAGASGEAEDLAVHGARQERRVDERGVGADEGFERAFGVLGAVGIFGMTRRAGGRRYGRILNAGLQVAEVARVDFTGRAVSVEAE